MDRVAAKLGADRLLADGVFFQSGGKLAGIEHADDEIHFGIGEGFAADFAGIGDLAVDRCRRHQLAVEHDGEPALQAVGPGQILTRQFAEFIGPDRIELERDHGEAALAERRAGFGQIAAGHSVAVRDHQHLQARFRLAGEPKRLDRYVFLVERRPSGRRPLRRCSRRSTDYRSGAWRHRSRRHLAEHADRRRCGIPAPRRWRYSA